MMYSRKFQWMLFLLAVATYAYLPVWSVGHGLSSNDFKHIYLGMKALLDGSSPYPIQSLHHQAALQGYRQISLNPYVYLPFTGYAMSFLAPFNLGQAVWVWFVLNHAFAIGCIVIMSQWFPKWRLGAASILILAFAINVPFYRTLSAGQLNMPLLFMLTLGFSLMQKNRLTAAGSLIAFATLYKLMPGIYGFAFLITKQFRPLLSFVVTGIVLGIISTSAAGLNVTKEFLGVLSQMGYGKSTWPWAFSFWNDPPNQSLNSFFSHIFTNSDHSRPWIDLGQQSANIITTVVTLCLLVAWALALWKHRAKVDSRSLLLNHFPPALQATWCSTLIIGLLIPSLMWDHYLVMLILPVSWMIKAGIKKRYYFSVGLAAACFALTALPWNFDSEAWQAGPAIVLISIKLWPTLILFGLSLCFIKWSNEIVADSTTDECNPIPGLSDTENIPING